MKDQYLKERAVTDYYEGEKVTYVSHGPFMFNKNVFLVPKQNPTKETCLRAVIGDPDKSVFYKITNDYGEETGTVIHRSIVKRLYNVVPTAPDNWIGAVVGLNWTSYVVDELEAAFFIITDLDPINQTITLENKTQEVKAILPIDTKVINTYHIYEEYDPEAKELMKETIRTGSNLGMPGYMLAEL